MSLMAGVSSDPHRVNETEASQIKRGVERELPDAKYRLLLSISGSRDIDRRLLSASKKRWGLPVGSDVRLFSPE